MPNKVKYSILGISLILLALTVWGTHRMLSLMFERSLLRPKGIPAIAAIAELKLSPEQKAKITLLEKDFSAHIRENEIKVGEQRIALCRIIMEDAPSNMKAPAKKLAEALTEQEMMAADYLKRVVAILTPGQKTILMTKFMKEICLSCRKNGDSSKDYCGCCEISKAHVGKR